MTTIYNNNTTTFFVFLVLFSRIVPFFVVSKQIEVIYKRQDDIHLRNHVIRQVHVHSEMECGFHCAQERSCLSVNYKTMKKDDELLCELNNASLNEVHHGDVHAVLGVSYFDVVRRIPAAAESAAEENSRTLTEKSCKDVYQNGRATGDGIYNLMLDPLLQEYTPVYCHMTSISGCGAGGWTLAIKMDGSKETFKYTSLLWTDMVTFQETQGLDGLTTQVETKLSTYWKTSFSAICIGMTRNGDTNWLKFSFNGNSLYDVISDGSYKATSIGRQAWKSLIHQSSLQSNCNKEGFNIVESQIKARLALIGNNEGHECHSSDSWIGFGVESTMCGTVWNIFTCGNVAMCASPDNGNIATTAFGYIFVQ